MPTLINLRAIWNPGQQGFQVEFVIHEGERYVEFMRPERFLEFVDRIDREVIISGITVRFEGISREDRQQVSDYFRKVRDSYLAAKDRGEL